MIELISVIITNSVVIQREREMIYCISGSFAGLPADQIARLQQTQNNAAGLVMKQQQQQNVIM